MRLYYVLLLFMLLTSACTTTQTTISTSTSEPSPSPAPTQTSSPTSVTVGDIACPESFQETEQIERTVTINGGGVLTLTLGATPSIPCGWQDAEIENPAILRQVDHQRTWPAAGTTPMPGAPGSESWTFTPLQRGKSAISLACTCLGEEGVGQDVMGTLVVNVTVE